MDPVQTEGIDLSPLDQIPNKSPINRHVNYEDPQDLSYSHSYSVGFAINPGTNAHQNAFGGGGHSVATEIRNNSKKKDITGTYIWNEHGNTFEFDNFKPKRDEITFYENSHSTTKIDLQNPNVESDWIIDQKKDGTYKIEGLRLVIRGQSEIHGEMVEDYRKYGTYVFDNFNWDGLVKSMKNWDEIPHDLLDLERYVATLPSKKMSHAEASEAQTALDLLNPEWYLPGDGIQCCW